MRPERMWLRPAAALALCLACAPFAPRARGQAPARPGSKGQAAPRVIAALADYRGPSGFLGRPALVAFSPDGRLLALSGQKEVVNLFDAETGGLLHTFATTQLAGLDAFSFSPDGRTAATRDRYDKSVRIWDLATGRQLLALAGRKRNMESEWKALNVSVDEFIPVPFGPGGRTVLVEREDDLVTVFEAATGRELSVLDHRTETNKGKDLLRLALTGRVRWLRMRPVLSPDGRLVVTANGDRAPKLWEAATGRLVAALEGHRDAVYNAAFSPDSRLLATETRTGTVHLWDAATGRPRATLKAAEIDFSYFNVEDVYYTPSFAFGPDSRTLVTFHDRATEVWDAEAGTLRRKLKKAGTGSVAFSPDGRLFATAGGGSASAKLWDAETGRPVRELPKAEKAARYVAFSPDGRLLLTASDAGLRLWDAATGEPVAALPRSRFPARFSPDGRRLATGGNEKTAYLYEVGGGNAGRRAGGRGALVPRSAFRVRRFRL